MGNATRILLVTWRPGDWGASLAAQMTALGYPTRAMQPGHALRYQPPATDALVVALSPGLDAISFIEMARSAGIPLVFIAGGWFRPSAVGYSGDVLDHPVYAPRLADAVERALGRSETPHETREDRQETAPASEAPQLPTCGYHEAESDQVIATPLTPAPETLRMSLSEVFGGAPPDAQPDELRAMLTARFVALGRQAETIVMLMEQLWIAERALRVLADSRHWSMRTAPDTSWDYLSWEPPAGCVGVLPSEFAQAALDASDGAAHSPAPETVLGALRVLANRWYYDPESWPEGAGVIPWTFPAPFEKLNVWDVAQRALDALGLSAAQRVPTEKERSA